MQAEYLRKHRRNVPGRLASPNEIQNRHFDIPKGHGRGFVNGNWWHMSHDSHFIHTTGEKKISG